MLLSIMILTIATRAAYFERLMAILRPQLTAEVELLVDCDNGEVSIGAKRQRLLQQATGEYVCFIDDDDLVPEDYVEATLAALVSRPDCVGWKMHRLCDGVFEREQIKSLRYRDTRSTQPEFEPPDQLSPIRREIARKVGFLNLNRGEDTAYSDRVQKFLKIEVFLDRVMYTYEYRTFRGKEVTNASRVPPPRGIGFVCQALQM